MAVGAARLQDCEARGRWAPGRPFRSELPFPCSCCREKLIRSFFPFLVLSCCPLGRQNGFPRACGVPPPTRVQNLRRVRKPSGGQRTGRPLCRRDHCSQVWPRIWATRSWHRSPELPQQGDSWVHRLRGLRREGVREGPWEERRLSRGAWVLLSASLVT